MIKNLSWTPSFVSWEFDGNKICYDIPDVILAKSDDKYQNIIVDIGKNFHISKRIIYSVVGDVVFQYDQESNTVQWDDSCIKRNVNIPDLVQAIPLHSTSNIMILSGKENGVVTIFDRSGNMIFSKSVPKIYHAIYLTEVNACACVVCDADAYHEDKYGLNRFNLLVNMETQFFDMGTPAN